VDSSVVRCARSWMTSGSMVRLRACTIVGRTPEASGFPTTAQQFDGFFNCVVSMTLMNERFGMTG
jgi:hypothetical protein